MFSICHLQDNVDYFNHNRYVQLADRRVYSSLRWVSQLGSRLSKGLEFISFDRREITNEQQAFWSISVLQACEEFSSNMQRRAQSNEDIAKAKALEDITDRASAELLNGVGIHQELVIAVVQKSQV